MMTATTEAKESTQTIMNVDQGKTKLLSSNEEEEERSLSNEECAKLLEEGRQLCRNAEYAKATETLSTAVEHFVKKNGTMCVESARYYFEYGRALFRLAQSSVDVFGDAVRQKNAEINDAENLEEIAAATAAAAAAAAVLPAIANGSSTDEPTPTVPMPSLATATTVPESESKTETETETNAKTETETENQTGIAPTNGEDVEVNGDSKEEESGDAENEVDGSGDDDKIVAWEVIELARIILENALALAENTDQALMLAEVFALLAEHQLEDEKFPEAHADYLKCIELRTKHLGEDHRDVAAAHFLAGLVCEYAGDLDNADAHFTNALVGLTNWTETKLSELGSEIPALSDKAEELTLREAIDRVLKPSEIYLEQNKDLADSASVSDLVSVTESIRALWERIDLLKREPDELSQIQRVVAGELEIPQIPLPSDTLDTLKSDENGVTETIGFGDVSSGFDGPVNEVAVVSKKRKQEHPTGTTPEPKKSKVDESSESEKPSIPDADL